MTINRFFAAVALCLIVSCAMATQRTQQLDCVGGGGPDQAEMKFDLGGAHQVNITYIGKRPARAQIARALRACLGQAIKIDGSKDIAAAAWFRAHPGDPEMKDVPLHPFGGPQTYLAYQAATRSVSIVSLKRSKPIL